MNPKQFLLIGGVVLVIVGLAGFFGIIGPTPERSLFGPRWWFDNGENWAHLILGIVALISAYILNAMWQKWLVLVLGVVGLLVALWGFLVSGSAAPNFYGANLENPADNILHLLIGIWALWAMFRAKKVVSAAPSY